MTLCSFNCCKWRVKLSTYFSLVTFVELSEVAQSINCLYSSFQNLPTQLWGAGRLSEIKGCMTDIMKQLPDSLTVVFSSFTSNIDPSPPPPTPPPPMAWSWFIYAENDFPTWKAVYTHISL